MSLQLFRKRKAGGIESGWFEPEESRKKRDNGWVTNSTGENPKVIVVNPEATGICVEHVGEVSKDNVKVTIGVDEDKPEKVVKPEVIKKVKKKVTKKSKK